MARSTHPIGILGAGAMGSGIAQVAAVHGFAVLLMDANEAAVPAALDSIAKRLDRQVAKDLIDKKARDAALRLIKHAKKPEDLRECDLLIEAIVEDLDIKVNALTAIVPHLAKDAVIASNTSSLSISKIGEAIGQAHRTVGLHFFNPAPLMPLVEVIAGAKSDANSIRRATLIAESWGKTVVRANDVPGFIVNRVARPYYLEAFRILEDGYASVEEIDKAMRDLGGFRMGPFELTDLIGHDINAATTQSVWEQLGKPARLAPSTTQQQLVKDGRFGLKSKRGVYDHEIEPPKSLIEISRKPLPTEGKNNKMAAVVNEFVSRATEQIGSKIEKYVFARILVAIINEAAWALNDNVASAADINTALKLGTNYPKGPLEWAEEIGYGPCGALLDALNAGVADNRFAAAEILKTRV
jgi:3-hydroxybutyryl-CoA dehydrogenase